MNETVVWEEQHSIRCLQIDPKPMDTILHIISYDVPIKFLCPPALLGLFLNQDHIRRYEV